MATMNSIRLPIKPLTINRAWQGRRFKTPEYKAYAEHVGYLLPPGLQIPDGLLIAYYEFGFSNFGGADNDNPVKMIQDIISAKYGFNDNQVVETRARKVKVKKGCEYIRFGFMADVAGPYGTLF